MNRIDCIAITIVIALGFSLGASGNETVIDVNSERFREVRDPFSPVAHKPASESEQIEKSRVDQVKSRINWPSIPLRGVTHAGSKRFIAIIDGIGLVESGDVVSIARDGLIYRWKIDKVTAAGISSTRLDVTEASADQ